MNAKPKKHLLFIAFPFPPSRGAGVYRTVAMANFFVRRGWKVTVIAPHVDYFAQYVGSEDTSLLRWVDKRVNVVRVEVINRLLDTRVEQVPVARMLAPNRYKKARQTADRYLSPLDHYPFWPKPVVSAARKIWKQGPFDVILATGNPFSSFSAAWAIAKRTGVPYVLDYRDAWTFDQFTGELKPGATRTALAQEYALLHDALLVISVNRPIVDWLMTTHSVPRSVHRLVIENGYDSEFVESLDPRHRSMEEIERDGALFSYIGTVIPQKLDWEGFLHTWRQIHDSVDYDLRLDIHGHLGFSRNQAEQLGGLFEGHGVRHHGSTPKASVSSIYAQSDALILPMYESPYVTGGKVYEMMATGKPILAVGSRSAGAMTPLKGYPKLVAVHDGTVKSLRSGVDAALRLASVPSPVLDEAARGYARRFDRREQLRPLVNLLNKIV